MHYGIHIMECASWTWRFVWRSSHLAGGGRFQTRLEPDDPRFREGKIYRKLKPFSVSDFPLRGKHDFIPCESEPSNLYPYQRAEAEGYIGKVTGLEQLVPNQIYYFLYSVPSDVAHPSTGSLVADFWPSGLYQFVALCRAGE